jgi:hypothetical protein
VRDFAAGVGVVCQHCTVCLSASGKFGSRKLSCSLTARAQAQRDRLTLSWCARVCVEGWVIESSSRVPGRVAIERSLGVESGTRTAPRVHGDLH